MANSKEIVKKSVFSDKLYKPTKMIEAKISTEMAKQDFVLLNTLMSIWQTDNTDNLFKDLNNNCVITQSILIKKLGLSKQNANRIMKNGETFLDNLFSNLKNCQITLKECVLPLTKEDGNLVFDTNGKVVYQQYSRAEFSFLDFWGIHNPIDAALVYGTEQKKIEEINKLLLDGTKEKIYEFKLSDTIKGLIHLNTLTQKDNGIGYNKVNLNVLMKLRTTRAMRLYEYMCKNTFRNNKKTKAGCFYMSFEEASKILEIEKQNLNVKRMRQIMERLCSQLEDVAKIDFLVRTDKQSGSSFIYFEFKAVDDKVFDVGGEGTLDQKMHEELIEEIYKRQTNN